jgi:eukaryotic-like serine/threonine-protein kinase
VSTIGDQLNGKYTLLRLIGEGGMGCVFEAEHVLLGTRVAIKVLHSDLVARPGLVERFLQEARVSAQIKSPHVVAVSDVDRTHDGTAYLVMELLTGEPLSARLERDGKLAEPLAVEYTLQILQALEAAHALHVVHRDLKPENVLVTMHNGKPMLKLIDFGIAKLRDPASPERNLTIAGMVMGTAEYMAPEQAAAAEHVDGRADLYAVSVMLFEMIAGCRPAHGDDARIVSLRVQRGEIKQLMQVAPECTPAVAALVHRGLAFHPQARFANATEMRLLLEQATGRTGHSTAPLAAASFSAGPVPSAPAVTRREAAGSVPHQVVSGHAYADAHSIRHASQQPAPAAPRAGTELALPAAAARAHVQPARDHVANVVGPGHMPQTVPRAPGAAALNQYPSSAQRSRNRTNSATPWLYGALALLVGAGIVGGLVYVNQTTETSPAQAPLSTTTAPSASASATIAGPARSNADTTAALPALKPADQPAGAIAAGPRPGTPVRLDAGAQRDAASPADAGNPAPPLTLGIPGLSVTVPQWDPNYPFPPPIPFPTAFPGVPAP